MSLRRPVTKNIRDIERSDNFRRYFSIDSQKCVACRVCMKICPCKSINIINQKEYKFRKYNCAYCGLCQKACPKQAIKFSQKKEQK